MDFPNTSGIRSPFSPRVRQSITGRRAGLSSAKKNQSKFMPAEAPTGDVIYKTPLTTVETFGHPLPVLVTEALTFASGEVTVRLSPCGYCWLVSGRRLLCWARDGGAARELTLPQTDLQHRAELVEVFYEDGAQMPSCIGVSPEGVVRYWPSVGQELYADTSCELAGQECAKLCAMSTGLLLATTSCSLLLLHPEPERPGVSCRPLRPPAGWLGGLGRRVSLLFFGAAPAGADTKLVGVVVLRDGPMAPSAAEPGCLALVGGGGGGVLQLWRGRELHEHNLRRALTDACRAQGEAGSLQASCLDARAAGPRALVLLVALAHVARAPDPRHAVAHMSVEDPANPRVTSLVALRGCALAADCAPRLLPLPGAILLYTGTYVARVNSTVSNDKVEYIDVSSEGDRILGAELCHGRALLFSRKHGVLVLTCAEAGSANVSVCESPMGSPCPSDMYDGNLSLYEIDPNEVSMVTTDACGKLKTAFLFHLRRDTAACRSIVDELFPAKQREKEDDSALDRTVVRIATELCDDVPQGDPRWKQRPSGPATNIPLGSSTALQITAQLRDKQRAFSLFADFLRATGLWHRLGTLSLEPGGECISTVAALGMLAEKLAIALALRKKQQSGDAQLIDAAIYQVVCGAEASGEEPEVEAALSSGALSPSDVCYRRVSGAARVLRALCGAPPAAPDARAHAQHAAQAARLLTYVLNEVHLCRAQWQQRPPCPQLGPGALLPKLLQLHHRAVAQLGPACPDPVLRASLYEATSALADLVLTEAEPLRLHPHTRHVADQTRRDVIQPYIDAGQTERAAVLAEKFKDFELLIEMCVQQDDMERLYSYIDKYSGEGIAECAFSYLLGRGGAGAARLVRSLGARYPARLLAWLAPRARLRPARALLLLAGRDHGRAAGVLAGLAAEEKDSVKRMTTTASLAKLCLLASDEEPQPSDLWNKVESCLSLAEQHSALPRDIKLMHGLDTADCRVLPAEDLVQMYIDSESDALTEYDYKKALDLTDFVQDMEQRDDLRLRVWCACARRSSWEECNVEAPAAELQQKMFFRLMHLVHFMGGDLELVLPPAEDILTAPELAELASDPRFRYIIKYGYECFHTPRSEDAIEA